MDPISVWQKPTKHRVNPLLNRELGWMAFNDRVLEEAQDPSTPLVERLKYVSIVSSNLDEFFMIRVAGLERKLKTKPDFETDDGLKADEVLSQIREWTLQQKSKQAVLLDEILESLRDKGIFLQTRLDVHQGGGLGLRSSLVAFAEKILPEIKVEIIDTPEKMAKLESGRIYVYVRLKDRFTILQWPETFDRLIKLPAGIAEVENHFILAEKLVATAAAFFFKDDVVLESFPFKVIRDADFKIDPNIDPDSLIEMVEAEVKNRGRKPLVRLEIDGPSHSEGALTLAAALKLHPRNVYRYDLPLDLRILWRLYGMPEAQPYRNKPFSPRVYEDIGALVERIAAKDILLHHPFDSFETIVKLLGKAAIDPNVTEIYLTLYRTNAKSPIAQALVEAAKNGKKVVVIIELRARFDEARNIELAREFKKYGIKVLKGFADKKIHCKLTYIKRRENGVEVPYLHVGTGNYNPSTAKLYTDLSLLTSRPEMARDAERLFKAVESRKMPKDFESFVAAPLHMHEKMLALIQSEAQRAQAGDKDARIIAKMNALVDSNMVKALYAASQAGVKIDLIVRGICVLRPGVPGLSENIRVVSIVDKYLEHSRIYYFHNGGQPLVYLSSADWMPRNLHQRLEISFPIVDEDLKRYVRDVILKTLLRDNQKARLLLPQGQWVRLRPEPGQTRVRSQIEFEKRVQAESPKEISNAPSLKI